MGASGDLAPLSHLALVLIGEGEVIHQGKRMPSAAALKQAGIKPLVLEAKESISLINGTQAMLAVGLLTVMQVEILADSADVIAGLVVDAQLGTNVAFDERIHRARPHAGQLQVAKTCAACSRTVPSASRIVIAARCRMPIPCAASPKYTARYATPWRTAAMSSKSR